MAEDAAPDERIHLGHDEPGQVVAITRALEVAEERPPMGLDRSVQHALLGAMTDMGGGCRFVAGW